MIAAVDWKGWPDNPLKDIAQGIFLDGVYRGATWGFIAGLIVGAVLYHLFTRGKGQQ